MIHSKELIDHVIHSGRHIRSQYLSFAFEERRTSCTSVSKLFFPIRS